jgi:hypothetical protein
MYLTDHPQRGPRIRLGRLRGLRGLRGLAAIPGSSPPDIDPSDVGGCWMMYVFGQGAYNSCIAAGNNAGIQSVPSNAAAYGYAPNVVAAAQAMATQQEAMTDSDIANVDTFYNLPSSPLIPSTGPGFDLGDPTTWPAWLWIAIAGGGGLLVWSAVK